MIKRALIVIVLAGVAATAATQELNFGSCLTEDETELLQLINEYRTEKQLPPIWWSKSLSAVGQWHVWDLVINDPVEANCNHHSWSEYGLTGEVYWTPVCYTPDHANAAGMWIKPSEITANVYTGNGYEIAVSSGGYISPSAALNAWKNSVPHNDVILNQGLWTNPSPWPAMGAGMRDGFAVVWFGDTSDPAGFISLCGDSIFSDGFELGDTGSW